LKPQQFESLYFGSGWTLIIRLCGEGGITSARFAVIVVSAIRQLSWTHFIALIPLKDSLQREFYIELCKIEGWNVKTLRQKIDGMLYERTAISKKPDRLIKKELKELREDNKVTPDLIFRDPYKGQMELYLRWLEKNEMQKGEKTPIGLILCAEGNNEQVELLQLDKAGIKVAEYLTELPSKKTLKQKLHQAVELSRETLENRIEG